MDPALFVLLCALVLGAAVLYSSGGHAGGTAYLAAMALVGMAPDAMKPTALVLNVVVASIGAWRFGRAGATPWRTLGWLLAGSVPAAFAGGRVHLPGRAYLVLLGATLLVASARLWLPKDRELADRARDVPPAAAWLFAVGAALGLLAGLTGIGGGIFLTPVLILAGWESPRRTAGAAVTFILLNSLAGLAGHASSVALVPPEAAVLAVLAAAGGTAGTWLGVARFGPGTMRRVNAVILVLSGAKLLWDGLHGLLV